MHVVLPELDGRILAGAIGFKAEREADAALAFRGFFNRPEPDRIEQVAARIAAMVRLQQTPREQRRIAILMPDYPGAAGRTGYAVGLDVPSQRLAMLHDLKNAGYAVEGIPQSPRALLDLIERGERGAGRSRSIGRWPTRCRRRRWRRWRRRGGRLIEDAHALRRPPLPAGHSPARGEMAGSFGNVETASRPSPPLGEMSGRTRGGRTSSTRLSQRAFPFRAARFGNVTVALAPDRGRSRRPPRRLSRPKAAAAP